MRNELKAATFIYSFDEGSKEMAALLGNKGAHLAEMTRLGLPVPPGFTITTAACTHYAKSKSHPAGLKEQLSAALAALEKKTGKKLGDEKSPLLLSVRSGAAVSMPGMMDTVLNIGLTEKTLAGLIAASGNERFARDCYRRLLQMFGNVVLGIRHEQFEALLSARKKQLGITLDTGLKAADLKALTAEYLKLIAKETGKPFPQDAKEQLLLAVNAVFGSWGIPRARAYRDIHGISHDLGTAVNVQSMVFGNFGDDSATGVVFTRDPSTGENGLYGEYLPDAQGEDVVAGIRTPQPIAKLAKEMPAAYKQLDGIAKRVERHYREMQDMEFTVERGTLYVLQTRSGKRTAQAAVRIAVEMERAGMLSRREALLRVSPEQLEQLMHKRVDPKSGAKALAKGLPASPGAATGIVVFTAERAAELKGKRVILVRPETSPEDIQGMHAAQGILTSRGGMTSHAAIVARGMGKCCVVGCESLEISEERREFRAGGQLVKEGEVITLNGSTGEVLLGEAKLIDPEMGKEFTTLMSWADSVRRLGVRANADTPVDARKAAELGAEGIGLCRTEHMFFAPDRILAMREMIMSRSTEERRRALAKILPMQREDFIEIFRALDGKPVTIRLLDPPLHEFLPAEDSELASLAKELRVSEGQLRERIALLREANPMLGHRGCRLAVTNLEICEMQTRAILEAACDVTKGGGKALPEIMVPLVGHVNELSLLKGVIERTAEQVFKERGKVKYTIGTMIEVPRACVTADEIAAEAEFFSFGTNDLTQMAFGFSRDDINKFLPAYLEKGILPADPFQTIDQAGVGSLVKEAVAKGRSARKGLKIGICGEHGGDPKSVAFCHSAGLDYVSCSPYRVPIARLAAAHAALSDPSGKA